MRYVINCTIIHSAVSDIFVATTISDAIVSFNLPKLQQCRL
jgi:hypothetical protein